ncbi:MAG: glutamate-5-semialdehyde dehydrogenase, partial [Glaciihabitans sp.]|nr:glutamate-5-semialdehyde dehydrogenase [Glaciihabitans sp.]
MPESAVATATFVQILEAARASARVLANVRTEQKNRALHAIAAAITRNADRILPANEIDLANARENGLSEGMQDRLRLDFRRLEELGKAVVHVASLVDPIGEAIRGSALPNGLRITEIRVPFGVVGAIYEARPNVTIDIAALALKSGNAVVLRGGSAAENTNRVLVELLQGAIASEGLPPEAIQTIDEFGRDGARDLMQARGYVDVLIPRGSAELINTVVSESKVPVIETGAGVVHVYLDESADEAVAIDIVRNAKVQRPSVCNALETLLVHAAA